MDLDDLKKTWNLIDEQLKDKELIREEDISQLVSKADSGISALSHFLIRGIVASLILIAYFFASALWDNRFDWFFTILLILCIPAFGWDLFTTRFLRQTRVDKLPLVTVVARINRYYRWMIWEGIVGAVFVISVAAAFFIDRQLWHFAPSGILLFFLLWTVILGFLYWMYQKRIMNRLHNIRKNLKELKELKEQ